MRFLTTAELAEALHCNTRQIGRLRRNGLIGGIRAGHGFVYSEKEIERFYDLYSGFDLSSDEKMRYAVTIKKGCSEQPTKAEHPRRR